MKKSEVKQVIEFLRSIGATEEEVKSVEENIGKLPSALLPIFTDKERVKEFLSALQNFIDAIRGNEKFIRSFSI